MLEKLKEMKEAAKKFVRENPELVCSVIMVGGTMTAAWISWGKGLQAGMSLQASHDADLIELVRTTYGAAAKFAETVAQ